jgi:hypothetical protein
MYVVIFMVASIQEPTDVLTELSNEIRFGKTDQSLVDDPSPFDDPWPSLPNRGVKIYVIDGKTYIVNYGRPQISDLWKGFVADRLLYLTFAPAKEMTILEYLLQDFCRLVCGLY